ncbi:outer membrane beta-barrel protein [Methyloligella sp. 2.7D]|uniref:outer membrane protein n=1 Tax=unclassified Methyloligella TaxID=2625955 RepID=UPI00157D3E93|nr:outer membrane beta-barrel protein [Methyloligella sp. GL2]QKP77053.1 porin family protein [Methyloligella sp. GL2]
MSMGRNAAAGLAAIFAVAMFAVGPAQAQYYSDPAPLYDPGPSYGGGGGMFEGWYLGGTLGGATLNNNFSGRSDDISGGGVLGGIQGGNNWQMGRIVVGVEGDIIFQSTEGSGNFNNGRFKAKSSVGTQGDLRARLGVKLIPQVLVFGTFGGAIADSDLKIKGPVSGSSDGTLFGWSIGGGAEVALNSDWSARFDYQFTDFGSETVSYGNRKDKFDINTNTFRGSLSYHF